MSATQKQEAPSAPVAVNRRARFDYFIEEEIEAGIVLTGTEVKSLRRGRASINEAHAGERQGELWLFNALIAEYEGGNRMNHDPKRARKLLLHARQAERLMGQVKMKGKTVVPLKLYFNRRGLVKVLLGLASGKKQVDKRDAIKERDWKRQQGRLMKSR